jgi:hypothetical protein
LHRYAAIVVQCGAYVNWFFLINDHPFAISPAHIPQLTDYAWAVREGLEARRRRGRVRSPRGPAFSSGGPGRFAPIRCHRRAMWGGNWFFLINDHPFAISPAHIPQLTDYAWAVREG